MVCILVRILIVNVEVVEVVYVKTPSSKKDYLTFGREKTRAEVAKSVSSAN